jgi:hypothetical protein
MDSSRLVLSMDVDGHPNRASSAFQFSMRVPAGSELAIEALPPSTVDPKQPH